MIIATVIVTVHGAVESVVLDLTHLFFFFFFFFFSFSFMRKVLCYVVLNSVEVLDGSVMA